MLKVVRKPEVKQEEVTTPKEGIMMKIGNWSLKKKILVGAGSVAAVVLGVFAYGQCTQTDEVEYNGRESDEDEEDQEYNEDAELAELERMEKEETENKQE